MAETDKSAMGGTLQSAMKGSKRNNSRKVIINAANPGGDHKLADTQR